MKSITINLGEQEYEVRQRPYKQSREWREKFAEPIEKIVGALEFTGDLVGGSIDQATDLGAVIRTVGSMLLGSVSSTLIGSVDLIAEMLFDYAPELAADRARIEECAYDDEIMRAFVGVLGLAYPFSEILNKIRGRSN